MTQTIVLVVRGAPGSGKSTISQLVRDEMIRRGRLVSWLPWDTFHHFIEPRETLTKQTILNDTQRLLRAAVDCMHAATQIIIIDGVFLYPEENDAIRGCFPVGAATLLRYRLVVSTDNLLRRNVMRCAQDHLPSARIREVDQDPLWNKGLAGEHVLANDGNDPHPVAAVLCEHIEQHLGRAGGSFNPTRLDAWRMGSRLRCPALHRFRDFDLLSSPASNTWVANACFDFGLDPAEEQRLTALITQQPAAFNYLNADSRIIGDLRALAQRHGLQCEQADQWQAPALRIAVNAEVRQSLGKDSARFRRTLAKMDSALCVRFGPTTDRLQLWQDALWVDRHSWKADAGSDMHSLDREDLQYLPGVLEDPWRFHLAVAYHVDGTPGAWSLMLSAGEERWYAAKWGATPAGRQLQMGLECFVCHLEQLYVPERGMYVDLWGRRSEFYEQIATTHVPRVHLRVHT